MAIQHSRESVIPLPMNPEPSSTVQIAFPGLISTAPNTNRQTFGLALPSPNAIPSIAPSLRAWESSLVVLRVVVILCVLALLFTGMADRYYNSILSGSTTNLSVITVPLIPSIFWDLADSIVCFARRGRSIPPKAHIGCELIVLISCLLGAALFILQLLFTTGWLAGGQLPYACVMAICGGVVVISRISFFVAACVRRVRERKYGRPRAMFIPATGAVVYLVSLPAQGSIMLDEMVQEQADGPAGGSGESGATSVSSESTNLNTLMSPPTDDYVPDLAERERRWRGEMQPQLIIPDVSPGKVFAVEGKTLVRPKEPDRLGQSFHRTSWP